jgi:hypothetical protein
MTLKMQIGDRHVYFDLHCDTKIKCLYETVDIRHQILSKPEDKPSNWPDGTQLFYRSQCRFIDQGGAQLLIFGLPFFLFREPD